MEIRTALIDDIKDIQTVGRLSWNDTYGVFRSDAYIAYGLEQWWSSQYLENSIQSENHVLLVAETVPEIIGVAESQYLNETSAILWKLYVLKAHRRKGIGTALIEESIRRLSSTIESYYTEYDSQNKKAAAFYESRGFEFDRLEESQFHDEVITSVYIKRDLRG